MVSVVFLLSTLFLPYFVACSRLLLLVVKFIILKAFNILFNHDLLAFLYDTSILMCRMDHVLVTGDVSDRLFLSLLKDKI